MVVGRLSRNVAVAVGATSIQVMDAKERQSYSIMNTGATTISLALSDNEAAVVNTGIVLLPNSSLTDSDGGGYFCWKGAISAISNAAGGTIAIMERVYNPQEGK